MTWVSDQLRLSKTQTIKVDSDYIFFGLGWVEFLKNYQPTNMKIGLQSNQTLLLKLIIFNVWYDVNDAI